MLESPRPGGVTVARSALDLCLVAPPSLRIPPFHGYGGSQRGIYDLCHVLTARGHRVTLCGPGDSRASVRRLIAPLPHALWEDDSPYPRGERDALTERYAAEVAATLEREHFDLINVRFDHPGLIRALVLRDRAPVLYSCHNPASERFVRLGAELAGRLYTNAHCRAHREQYRAVPDMQVVPYGMDVHGYRFRPAPLGAWPTPPALPVLARLWRERRDYCAWIGRIAPSKGTRAAIDIARRAGLALVIAGAPENRHHPTVDYFEQRILPEVDDHDVFFAGVADEVAKQELLGGAVATLFTTGLEQPTWAEPFGRVIMESLACGTPLVAHAHGSAPEILTTDVAVLGANVAALAAAVPTARALDRSGCRRYAEHTFSRDRMGAAYEELFHAIVAREARRRTGEAACA
jgi:glycosyltransferase involved in cell wall biosynthesis